MGNGNSEQKQLKAIEELLTKLSYKQHNVNMIRELLSDYTYLVDDLKKCVDEGAKMVEIGREHSIIKPIIKQDGEWAIIYINK